MNVHYVLDGHPLCAHPAFAHVQALWARVFGGSSEEAVRAREAEAATQAKAAELQRARDAEAEAEEAAESERMAMAEGMMVRALC